jgi:CotH kinase protein
MNMQRQRLGTFALAALLLFSLTPRSASALTPAAGDPAAALYQTSKVVRIDLKTNATLNTIGIEAYVDATFKLTIGNEVFGGTSGFGAWDIKLRLKGNRSFRSFPAKAALRLEFPNELQRVFGIKRMTLNNMIQDRSKINEAVGYTLFRGMGIAAPRTSYAQIWVNDVPYGLYLNVESIDSVALEKRDKVSGSKHLYEGSLGAQGNPLDPNDAHYQVDVGSLTNRSDLAALISASQEVSTTWYSRVNAVADLKEMTRFWAVERYIGNWDGYSSPSISNYYLHSDSDGRFQMLPWGIDQIFSGGIDNRAPYSFGYPDGGLLFERCLTDKTCRALYVQALRDVRDKAGALGLAGLAASLHATLASKIATDAKDETSPTASKAAQVAASNFITSRPADLNDWLTRLTRVTAPAVSGAVTVGTPLSASSGSWSYGPTPKYAYQWFRCHAAKQTAPKVLPAGCKAIATATSATYSPSAADRGSYLRVRVKATTPTSSALWFSKPTAKVP